QKQITPLNQCFHLPICDRPLVHPEPAVGMNPFDAARADHLLRRFNSPRYNLRSLHRVYLDIDHADAQRDFRIELLLEIRQLIVSAERELEDDVIEMQRVEETD